MTTKCDWPSCIKRVQKLKHLNFCRTHHRTWWLNANGLNRMEGPVGLNLPVATVAEIEEYSRTGEIPASRRIAPTFDNTCMTCARCGGPLIMVNDADWTADAPPTKPNGRPWGIGICRVCSAKPRKLAVMA